MVAPLASVIVPTYNGAHLLEACLRSLVAQSYREVEVIVADGASRDATPGVVARACPTARLVRLERNRGFSGNVNAGIRAARGDVICLLNNDAEADPDWIAACVDALERDTTRGSIASKILFADGRTINSAGDVFGRDGAARQRGVGQPDGPLWTTPAPVFGASGGAVAYRRAMLADVGLFDEAFFMYLEDVDLALRARLRGWECWYEPAARVHHVGSATGGGQLASYYNGRNAIRLVAKDLPSDLLRRMLPAIVRFQVRRARSALAAWRGSAARATLRGQVAGLVGLPAHVAARPEVQRRRRVSSETLYTLFSSAEA